MNNFKTDTLRNSNFSESFLFKYRKQKLNGVSETHLLDKGGDYHGVQYEKYVYESDGVNTKITSAHITNQTVISSKGTASLVIAIGEIQIGTGWISEIKLSDGTFYKCEEQQGTIAYDASGNGNHGNLINNIIHTTKRDVTLINYTNEFGYSNNSGTIIPIVVNSNLDALGNTCEFIGKVDSDIKLINSNCINSDGISVEGTFNFDTTGLTITSKGGTANVTLDNLNNKITIGEGTLYNLVLSNGYHFPIAEGLGTRSYRVLDHEKYITWSNITWTTQDEYHYNINNGFTGDDIKLPLKGLIKVEDEPWTWITQEHYTNWKSNWFLPSTNGTLLKGDANDYAAITEIDLTNQSLTINFTQTLLSKFPNLVRVDLTGNTGITQYDAQSNNSVFDLRLTSTSITSLDCSNLTSLVLLFLQNTQLNSINTTGCTNLSFVNAFNCKLVNPNFDNLPNLITLNLSNNNTLTSVSFLNSTAITSLFINNTALSSINLSQLTQLDTFIAINVNTLTNLDISNNIALRTLTITNSNNINDFTIDNNPLLINVDVRANLSTTAQEAMLINLDDFGEENGIFQGRIIDSGSLTAAGLTAKSNLQAKGWVITGL